MLCMFIYERWGWWSLYLSGRCRTKSEQVTAFKWFINLDKQGWEKQHHRWKMVPGAVVTAQRQVLPCALLQTVGSPLPSALKQKQTKVNQTKQTKFSSVRTRECLASATEQHSCCVSLSLKWHARPLPRKILVPNTNHAPWLPSSVYSSRTATHPCRQMKDIKIIVRKSLTYCAGKSWGMLQR